MSKVKNRVGEFHYMNDGLKIKIIKTVNNRKNTIRYEDGVIKQNVYYSHIIEGSVDKPVNRIGEVHFNSSGLAMKIIEYINSNNVSIVFDSGYIVSNIAYHTVVKGWIKNLYHPLIYDVGFIGKGKYNSKTHYIHYHKWHSMLQRAYDKIWQEKHPSYIGCSVDECWYNFQVFAEWFEKNSSLKFAQGWELDKDILVKGNKIYSAETCCIVPQEINTLFIKRKQERGILPIGVTYTKNKTKFIAIINKKSMGVFESSEEAFKAYKTAKEIRIKENADKWKEQIADKIYQALMNYQVEITD